MAAAPAEGMVKVKIGRVGGAQEEDAALLFAPVLRMLQDLLEEGEGELEKVCGTSLHFLRLAVFQEADWPGWHACHREFHSWYEASFFSKSATCCKCL